MTGRGQGPRSGSKVPLFAVAVGLLVGVVIVAAVAVLVARDDGDGSDEATSGDGVTDVTGGEPIDDGGEVATLPAGEDAFGDVEVQGVELPELPDGGSDPAVGEPAPTLVGQTPSGEPITIDPSEGPMVVAFLAHWCPHCQAEVPRIVELASESPDGTTIEGVPFVAVLTASDPALENFPPGAWLSREGWPAPAMVDSQPESGFIPDAFRAYGVSGYPFLVAIDAEGEVVARSSGELGDEGLQAFFAQAAA